MEACVHRNPDARQDAVDGRHLMADQMDGQDTAADLPGSGGLSRGHTAGEATRRGFHVFPLLPGSKRPAVDRWDERACADPERVARYWPSSAHNVGIACGPSGLVVVDLDAHGELPEDWRAIPGVADGADVFAQLLEWAGETTWPATTWVRTPNGHHLYFRQPPGQQVRNSAGLVGPGVDVRGAGGFVVGAGSVIGGRRYELIDGSEPPPLPAWLARRLAPQPPPQPRPVPRGAAPGRLAALARAVRGGQPGDRNSLAFWAAARAGEIAAAGQADPGEAEELLVQAALDAGLRGGEREARATVRSGLRAGGAR
jgi:Bifunctional DNA primase/polymerase, N-terminal